MLRIKPYFPPDFSNSQRVILQRSQKGTVLYTREEPQCPLNIPNEKDVSNEITYEKEKYEVLAETPQNSQKRSFQSVTFDDLIAPLEICSFYVVVRCNFRNSRIL